MDGEGHSMGEAIALHDTGRSLKVMIWDLDIETFIPHSQIHDDSEVYRNGQQGELVVTEWLARERGWL